MPMTMAWPTATVTLTASIHISTSMKEEEEEAAIILSSMIERNACMLKDLLATALEYDHILIQNMHNHPPTLYKIMSTTTTIIILHP